MWIKRMFKVRTSTSTYNNAWIMITEIQEGVSFSKKYFNSKYNYFFYFFDTEYWFAWHIPYINREAKYEDLRNGLTDTSVNTHMLLNHTNNVSVTSKSPEVHTIRKSRAFPRNHKTQHTLTTRHVALKTSFNDAVSIHQSKTPSFYTPTSKP